MAHIKFDKEIILEKSMEIAVEQGFASISVRNVAKKVGCSTAPIYTAFKNVDELVTKTKDKVLELLLEFIEVEYTHNTFLNVGVGTLVFASKYPRLYKELYIDSFDSAHERKLRERTLEQMMLNEISDVMDHKQLEIVLTKMWLVTHGIASKLCSGAIKVENEQALIDMLNEVGGEIITAMIVKSGKFKGNIDSLVEEVKENETACNGWDIWN